MTIQELLMFEGFALLTVVPIALAFRQCGRSLLWSRAFYSVHRHLHLPIHARLWSLAEGTSFKPRLYHRVCRRRRVGRLTTVSRALARRSFPSDSSGLDSRQACGVLWVARHLVLRAHFERRICLGVRVRPLACYSRAA